MNVSGFFEKRIAGYIFSLFYLSGLTFVILYFLSMDIPSQVWIYKGSPTSLLYIAVALGLFGFIGVISVKEDIKSAYLKLSLVTLIPGILALLMSIYGQQLIVSALQNNIFGFSFIQPMFISYLNSNVPKMWVLTVAYLLLGGFFFYAWLKP